MAILVKVTIHDAAELDNDWMVDQHKPEDEVILGKCECKST